jgi:ABC-type polysaccharide/polyol phosphate transport system ATPase subunit
VESSRGPANLGYSGADLGAAIVAERVSKQYPGRRVTIFPPVLSIFERDYSRFGRRRSATDTQTPRRPQPADDYDLDDDEDDEDDERELEEGFPPPRARPDEMFWALKDISFRVPPGGALGVLGGPGAGKSTLLRVLGRRALPTEGRALVRGRVAPLAGDVHKALALSGKKGDNVALAVRLLGVDAHVAKRHREEIEELAQPLVTPDGDPERGARVRLGVAATVILPADVILLDEPRGVDEAFMGRIAERLRERLRSGSSLVFASRQPELVQSLCDEVITLQEGVVVDSGDAKRAGGRYQSAPNGGPAPTGRRAAARARAEVAPVHHPADERELRVPPVVSAFNASAALLSAEVLSAAGVRSKRLDADDELLVEVRLETAVPDVEVQCGVCFSPRGSDTGLRLELPDPVRLASPRIYVLAARMLPGTLRPGGYEVRADAVVAVAGEHEATVIAREVPRLRIRGDELSTELPEAPVRQWDGRSVSLGEAEWSIE